MSTKKNNHLIKYVQIHVDGENIFCSYGFHFVHYAFVEMGIVVIRVVDLHK